MANIPYPADLGYCTITARVAKALLDGSDSDKTPDLDPLAGEVIIFTPTVRRVRYNGAQPLVLITPPVEATIGEDGILRGPDNSAGVILVATDDEQLNPTGWAYTVSFKNKRLKIPPFKIPAPSGGVLDLASLTPVDDVQAKVFVPSDSAAMRAEASVAKATAAAGRAEAAATRAETSSTAASRASQTATSKASEASTSASSAVSAQRAAESAKNTAASTLSAFEGKVRAATQSVTAEGENQVAAVAAAAAAKTAEAQRHATTAQTHANTAKAQAAAAKTSADSASASKTRVEDLIRQHGGIPGPRGERGERGLPGPAGAPGAQGTPGRDARDNIMIINGVEYQVSGTITAQVTSWAYQQYPVYSTTVIVKMPYIPPAGYEFAFGALWSSGFTFVDVGSSNKVNGTVNLRVTQFFSGSFSLSSVWWTLVKITS